MSGFSSSGETTVVIFPKAEDIENNRSTTDIQKLFIIKERVLNNVCRLIHLLINRFAILYC